jgi:hypothetical protein
MENQFFQLRAIFRFNRPTLYNCAVAIVLEIVGFVVSLIWPEKENTMMTGAILYYSQMAVFVICMRHEVRRDLRSLKFYVFVTSFILGFSALVVVGYTIRGPVRLLVSQSVMIMILFTDSGR